MKEDIKDLLSSGIINNRKLAREVWPVPEEKANDEIAVKKYYNSAGVRLDQKIKSLNNQNLLDEDIEQVLNSLSLLIPKNILKELLKRK